MLWMISAVLLCLIASVLGALLTYRAIRQANAAAKLEIESAQGFWKKVLSESAVSISGSRFAVKIGTIPFYC